MNSMKKKTLRLGIADVFVARVPGRSTLPVAHQFDFFRQGNPDLDPSYSNSFDFGYLKRWDKFTFNGSNIMPKRPKSSHELQKPQGQLFG